MERNTWKIPKSILKKNCKEYRFENNLEFWKLFTLDELLYESLQDCSPVNPFPDFGLVDEGLIQTYPVGIMRNYVLKNFPEIDPKQVRVLKVSPGGGEKIVFEKLAMFIPDKGKNGQRLTDMMRLGGYTLAREIQSSSGDSWKTLIFTPNFQVPTRFYINSYHKDIVCSDSFEFNGSFIDFVETFIKELNSVEV